jgi:2-polyprenyl-3-methyl-5-hydroxy-6-metoxy-1,4-benzoquinol methylase/glycosyltransferase involved in cell wall biosynthesis
MHVVGFGTYDRQKHPRVGILLDGLRQLGDEVTEINAPLGFSTAERVAMLGKPRLTYRLLLRLLHRWSTLTARRATTRPTPDVVLVGYLGQFDVVLARLMFPRTIIALDLLIFGGDTASDRGVRKGPKLTLLMALDRLAMACATLVIVDTEEHAALVPPSLRHKVVIAPVGSPDEWFAEPAEVQPGPLKVLFFGMFTPLQGAPVIGKAIALLPADTRIEFTMVGTGQDLAETRSLVADSPTVAEGPLVVWRDWVEPDELRRLLQDHQVCLGIFADTPKALRVTPNKVFQGAAAGCAILTSDTPPQRRALGDCAQFVRVADPMALAEALRFLAADPDEVHRLRTLANRRAEAGFRPRSVTQPVRAALLARTNRRGSLMTAPTTETKPLPPLAIRAWLRYDVVKRVIDRLKPRTALEIGCGQGAFGARLAGEVQYVAVEPDDSSYAMARDRIEPRGGTVLHGFHDAVPDGSSYDIVCAFEVLEHIDDDRGMLTQWVQLVRPGGHLLLSVPAFQERFGAMDAHAGHFRRYSPAQLEERLAQAGLTDIEVTVYAWPLGYALESVRNRIDANKLAKARGASIEELTAASGRTFQPTGRAMGAFVNAATIPFRYLQRTRPTAGTGLVAVARRPE